MSTRSIAAVRRAPSTTTLTPSTRTSRAKAREVTLTDDAAAISPDNDNNEKLTRKLDDVSKSICNNAEDENATKPRGNRSQTRRQKHPEDVKGTVSYKMDSALPISAKMDSASPISAIPKFISGSSSMRPPLSPSKSGANNNAPANVLRLPLSPSKSGANNNAPANVLRLPLSLSKSRLPLSPVKRPNGNPASTNSGFSPPKIVKNEENVSSHNKCYPVPPASLSRVRPHQSPIKAGPPQSPIRAGPPQSPLRRIESPRGKKADSPSVTPRSLFSASSKSVFSSLSPGFSQPLRTSCQPISPFKSPPNLTLAHSFSQNSTSSTSSSSSSASSSSSPLNNPLSVKRSDLFAQESDVSQEASAAPRRPSTPSTTAVRSTSPSSSAKVTEAASKLVLSPKTPIASSRIAESSSPAKPDTSPGKPAPSKAATPPSPSLKSKAPPSSPPTSPAESRLSRLNLNAAPSPYAQARKAFHTATPAGLIKGREAERKEIFHFIEDHLQGTKAGALYISGAPGTGKTATINTIVKHYKEATKCITIYINCMSVRNSSLIYAKILAEGSSSKNSAAKGGGGAKGAQKAVEKLVTSEGKQILLFLDEMDQLGDSKDQDVLYTLFEWTFTPGSRLVLVGVANALDLTERILPRLQAKAQRKPRTINFAPYSQGQLMDILSDRLSTSTPASADSSPAPSLVDKSALLFCSKKIAAISGDARKALDACRYAIEMVEKSSTESTPASTPFNAPSSSASSASSGSNTPSSAPKKVGITHVMRVLSGVYENAAVTASTVAPANAATSKGGGGTLTLQQKIIICCLVLIHKKGKNKKGVTLGNLQDVYKKVCQRKGFIAGMSEAGGSDQGEFLSTLSNIEASGILTIKKEKVSRDSKINLLLDEKELEKALQDDRKLLATILQSDII